MKNRYCIKMISILMTIFLSFGVIFAQISIEKGESDGKLRRVYEAFGLRQATVEMQNTMNSMIRELIVKKGIENSRTNKSSKLLKNYADFKPSTTVNSIKIIADTLGSNNEEKKFNQQLFGELKKVMESALTTKWKKNNLATAYAFLLATSVSIYHETPDPTDEMVDDLYIEFNRMFNEIPEMKNIPDKDKQFLYDSAFAFGSLVVGMYGNAQETGDKEGLAEAKRLAGVVLQDIFNFEPNTIRFEGDSLKFDSSKISSQKSKKDKNVDEKSNSKTSNDSGIQMPETNFNDGWVATAMKEYVRVVKDGVEVRLYHADAQTDKRRPQNTNTFEPFYWDAIVNPSFNAGQILNREKEQYSYGQADNWEASATDRQTGKKVYLGMRLVFNNGSCRTILVIARDKNTYYSNFLNDGAMVKMLNYNKFAVAIEDLIGKWSSFDAASINYYSIYSGDYAGTSTASTNDSFVFTSNGMYQSEHAGTSTFRGSTAHGKSVYKGNFSVNNWDLKATNRSSDDPGDFTCQFEAVKGGFVLKLVNKKYSGDVISLFKVK